MRKYLLFRLYGPMCSWGDIAVGETRPSFPHPTKSAVLGMVAAALGIKREEEEKHRQLAHTYAFAVLVEEMGRPLSDYHTAQVPPGRGRYKTRRDELMFIPKHELKTILSSRDYRTDAVFVVVLWEQAQSSWPPERLKLALEQPVFTLYLGRKSCPLALSLEPQIVEASTVYESLSKRNFMDTSQLGLKCDGQKMLYWEQGENAGVQEEHIFERRDIPLSRRRWQFDIRKECHAAFVEG